MRSCEHVACPDEDDFCIARSLNETEQIHGGVQLEWDPSNTG